MFTPDKIKLGKERDRVAREGKNFYRMTIFSRKSLLIVVPSSVLIVTDVASGSSI